jgi:hypothetical protein
VPPRCATWIPFRAAFRRSSATSSACFLAMRRTGFTRCFASQRCGQGRTGRPPPQVQRLGRLQHVQRGQALLDSVMTLTAWWPSEAPQASWANSHTTTDVGVQLGPLDQQLSAVATTPIGNEELADPAQIPLTVTALLVAVATHAEDRMAVLPATLGMRTAPPASLRHSNCGRTPSRNRPRAQDAFERPRRQGASADPRRRSLSPLPHGATRRT